MLRPKFDFAAAPVGAHDPYVDSIPACFERIAAAHPTRLAIGGGSWQPTYGELDQTANRIAHAILERGGVKGDRIAVLMQHDAPMVAAILGALKAGHVVATFNPTDPPPRLRQLVDSAEPTTIIVDAANRDTGALVAGNAHVLCFEDCAATGPAHSPSLAISADDHALIVFTSGSTGRPNGALHVHGAAIATAQATSRMQQIGPTDRVLLLASAGGGQGVGTLFIALLTGASLWPFLALERGVQGLADFLTENAITICTWSASIFRHLVMTIGPDRRFPAVTSIRMTSEKATQDDFRAFQQHFSDDCTLNYSLASSEAGQIARLSLRRSDSVSEGVLPIGRPHPGVRIDLLDESGRPVPRGEPGELVVTSRSVTIGYWRDPALSAERVFIPVDAPRLRSLRTRDLVRWNEDGQLEFVGRMNRRVKIRGYTVELLEVDQALRSLPGVKGAISNVFERPRREPQIAAFIIPDKAAQADGTLQPAKLRRALRGLLPRQMVPATFVFVDAFPLTANGKLDRNKLDALLVVREQQTPEEPRTETEVAVAEIWRGALELESVGRDDDFFDLGGDSLSASVAAAWVHTELGVEVDLGMFMAHPTLASFAAAIDQRRSRPDVAAQPRTSAASEGPLPLSFSQQYYWESSKSADMAARHTVYVVLRLAGPLNVDVLRECLDMLVGRHEILRTSFAERDGVPVQLVSPRWKVDVPFIDLSAESDPMKRLAEIQDDGQLAFDLTKPPLFSLILIKMGDQDHRLIFAVHHMIFDGWSARIFVREIASLYDATIRDEESPLPAVAARQYGDFTRWQRETYRPDSATYRSALLLLIDDTLRACYPDHPAYRKALLWLAGRMQPGPSLGKKVLGFLLRTLLAVPPPPGGGFPGRRSVALVGVDPAEGVIHWTWPPDVSRRLNALGRSVGATYYMVRLAGYAALLADELGDDRVVINTYFSNRHQPMARDVFGFCSNLVTLVVRGSPDLSFKVLLTDVRDRVRAMQGMGDFPNDELVRELRAWKIKPPRSTSYLSMTTARARLRVGELEISEPSDFIATIMPSGVDMRFDGDNERDHCLLLFDANLHDAAVVRAFVDRLDRLFDAASRQPELPLRELLAMVPRGG